MKSILLCEGKSDAILISYYLNKVKGWEFYGKKDKRKVTIPIRNNESEEVNWYSLGEDILSIWGIGGKSNFKYAIEQILKINRLADKEDAFNKIIIITDRDNSLNNEDILNELSKYLEEVNLQNNEWTDKVYINEFQEAIGVNVLPIIIPFDKTGALETFILDAICEMGEEEKQIVDKSKGFISDFSLVNYLNTERLRVKGELAVALGTMFPQKTFTPIDTMLRNINWEEYKTIQEGFKRLEEI
ncbi:hypothetical protein Q428_12435 [Fervidicella metallireducens AeB]|uniref:Uncharacterized protein n=1 Tax=Fervidicella metallireducens AeB TaxID=1403537 RepID=A0A017RSP9_9CLOT|nr:DUF3226 domain-containing protein [Fervidicella metallireducens]EYE87606.1 hypothetical protein Q428_12435 [Fervidicella metallireducens AeB]